MKSKFWQIISHDCEKFGFKLYFQNMLLVNKVQAIKFVLLTLCNNEIQTLSKIDPNDNFQMVNRTELFWYNVYEKLSIDPDELQKFYANIFQMMKKYVLYNIQYSEDLNHLLVELKTVLSGLTSLNHMYNSLETNEREYNDLIAYLRLSIGKVSDKIAEIKKVEPINQSKLPKKQARKPIDIDEPMPIVDKEEGLDNRSAKELLILPISEKQLDEKLNNLFNKQVKHLEAIKTYDHNSDEFMTRYEVAKHYDISLPTLRAWERDGVIPKAIRKNSRVYWLRSDIFREND